MMIFHLHLFNLFFSHATVMSKIYLAKWLNGISPAFNPLDMKQETIIADSVVSSDIVGYNVQGNNVAVINADNNVSSNVATQQYVDDRIESLMGTENLNASLNTILELNDAIGNDPDFYTHINQSVNDVANDLIDVSNAKINSSVANATFSTIIKANQVDSSLNSLVTSVNNLNTKTTGMTYNAGTTTFSTTVAGISKAMIGLSNCDNTSDINKPISTATQNALNTTNSNIATLQGKTNALSFDASLNQTTLNSKLVVALSETNQGNTIIGDQSTDTLTVNAATTFAGTVSGLTKTMVSLGNCDNTSDLNKPVSTLVQSALNLKANQSSLDTTNNNVATLQAKTNALSFDASLNQTTVNSKLVVSLSETNQGDTIIGDQSTDTLTVNAATTFAGTVSGLTKTMVSLGNCDNTSDLNKPVSTATQTALNLKANQSSLDTTNNNVAALQSKTNALSFDASLNQTTLNSKLVVALSETNQGNTIIGDQSTDTLTINAATTFAGTVSGLTKTMVSLGNCDNTSDLNKPVSTAVQTALNLKANDNAVVHLTTNETIAGTKTFSSNPLVPDISANDNSSKISNTKYVDTAIANLVGSAPSTLNTLNELASTLNNDPNFATTMATNLASKGGLSSNNTWSGTNAFPTITLNSVDLNTRLSSNESATSALQAKTNALSFDASLNQTTVNSKLVVSLSETNQGNTIIGDQSTDTLTINAATTFAGTVAGLTKTMVSLGNCDNTSDVNKPVSTATQTALNLKANQSSLDTTNSNVSALQAKTNTLNYDLATNTVTVNSKMVVAQDESLIGSIYLGDNSGNDIIYVNGNISSNSQTITQAQLGYISGLTSNVQTQITSKADDSAVAKLTGNQTIAGIKTFSSAPVLPSNSISNSMINNSCINSGYCDATSSIQTQIGTKAADSAVVKLTTDQTIAGIKTFSSAPVLPSNSISNSMINNSCINSGYCDATSSIQTQIGTKAADSAVVKLTTDQTIAGIKTFSSAPVLPSNSVSNSMINNSCINSGYCDATSSIQTQIGTKAADSAVVKLTTDQTIAGIKTFSSAPVLPSNSISNSMINNSCINSGYCDATSSIQTQIGTKATDSLTCHLANAETLTGTKTFAMVNEQVNSVSSVTTALSLDYATCKGINYIQTPTSNFSMALTNVPTGSTNAIYTLTIMMAVKYYCSSCTINGTSRTIQMAGGLSNASISASANYVIQTISIMFLNSSTPIVVSNVASLF
jgi:hypothetical protein